jgi:predicted outer membrane repeat protein
VIGRKIPAGAAAPRLALTEGNFDAVTVTDCSFDGNSATLGGGGVFVGSASTATVVNCTFVANIAPP